MSVADVLIVGCGPVGAMAANFLGRAGLSVIVIEQEPAPFPLPRAVHLDHEMMRLFQAIDVTQRVSNDMRDTDGHLHIGADHGVIRYMGTAGRDRPFAWSNDYFFYQPELEAHLREAMMAYDVELKLATRFVSLKQAAKNVTVTVECAGGQSELAARWVIACDGARSSVRKHLGIALDDLRFQEPWLVVDAEVDGPIRFPELHGVPPHADLQRLSVMMCDPNRPATIVPGRGNHRRWEFMLLPGERDEDMARPERVAELVGPYIEGMNARIVRAATYRFNGLVAKQWQQGRVFLAGDAAHQTPPFFGQGMCHGFRDVANLAWKLDLVARGLADEALLATYQPERDPHVRAVISASVEAGRYICMLDPAEAAQRDRTMRAQAKEAPRTAADLIPALRAGIVAEGTAGAGERFIQPLIQSDVPLDDVTGSGWRLFVIGADHAARARRAGDELAPQLGLAVIDVASLGDGGKLADWLQDRGATAAIVRPDAYVFGTADDDGAGLIGALVAKLGLAGARFEEQVA